MRKRRVARSNHIKALTVCDPPLLYRRVATAAADTRTTSSFLPRPVQAVQLPPRLLANTFHLDRKRRAWYRTPDETAPHKPPALHLRRPGIAAAPYLRNINPHDVIPETPISNFNNYYFN